MLRALHIVLIISFTIYFLHKVIVKQASTWTKNLRSEGMFNSFVLSNRQIYPLIESKLLGLEKKKKKFHQLLKIFFYLNQS